MAVQPNFLRPGVFDSQALVSVPAAKLLRRLGRLTEEQLRKVEASVREWLAL